VTVCLRLVIEYEAAIDIAYKTIKDYPQLALRTTYEGYCVPSVRGITYKFIVSIYVAPGVV